MRSPPPSSAPRRWNGGPWHELTNPTTGKQIVIKDMIADAMLQQILTRPTNTT